MKRASLWLFVWLAIAPMALRAQTGQDEIAARLLAQDYGALEQLLGAAQQGFEDGRLTEVELRDAFEPFTKLRDDRALERLRAWVEQSPRSYVAHLALGLNYRGRGSAARGRRFWDDTSPEKRDGFVQNFTLAEPVLRASIPLTSRPYLSALNLMTIAGSVGSRPFLNATLLLANDALPTNALARESYARYLLPRWGGSYAKFDAFVAISRTQGVADSTLDKLQAIALNDRGATRLAEHDDAGADVLFRQALERAARSDDDDGFRAAYLAASMKQVCKAAADMPACRPAMAGVAKTAVTTATTTAATRARPSGEDIEHAMLVPTEDAAEGVRSEYAWLQLRYPGAKRTLQALVPQADRHYDMLVVKTADGQELKVYFDVTAFYGKTIQPQRAVDAEPAGSGKS